MISHSPQRGNGAGINDIEQQASEDDKAVSVKESTTIKTSSDSGGNSLPWDWNRIIKWVNSLPWDWNIIVILVRMIALSLEPLFLYGLMINEYKKCVEIDRRLGITAIVSRSFLDISYLVLRFHTGFLGGLFRKYRRKLKNKLHRERKGAATSTPVKDLRKYFLHQHLLFDILVFLPIPQVVMLCVLLDVRVMKSLKTLQILNIFIFFQYWPRVFQIYLPRKDLGSNHEILGGRLWVLGPLDFFLYIIAGHVLGAFWYCFSIQRTVACWYRACENHDGCVRNSFYYCDHNFGYHSALDDFCPKNMPNAELFDFGVYLDAHQSYILESKNIPQKIFYCFCWGMRNLSSFGSNLRTSNDVWENCFVLCVTIFGLLLFLYYMGNFQIYLQRRITSKSNAEAAKKEEEGINPLKNMSPTKLKIPSGLTIVPRDCPIDTLAVAGSKAHITGSRTGVSQIPRDDIKEKGGDTEEKIDRFTSAPKGSAQPNSQAQAGELDRLIARVEQMYGMLESHVQHTTDQFTYVEGQITTLSSQIKDMMMEQRQQQEGSDSKSEQF